LRLLAPVVWVSSLGSALPETLAPLLAHGSGELPLVMGAAPFGMMAGALLLGRNDLFVDIRRQLVCAVALAAAFAAGAIAIGLSSAVWPLIAANVAIGAAGVWIIGARATFASSTPPDRMAQVEATMVASITVIEGAGVLGIGLLVTMIGTWAGYGVVAVALALATVPRLRRHERDVEVPLAVIELTASSGGDPVCEPQGTVVLAEHGGRELDDAVVAGIDRQPA
jgi:MFS family permease